MTTPALSFEFFPPKTLDQSFRLWETARALAPLGLFVLWHLAPMAGQARITHACNDVNMLLAAALLAVPAMGARLSSGSAGAGALGHAALNLAAFWIIAAHPPA